MVAGGRPHQDPLGRLPPTRGTLFPTLPFLPQGSPLAQSALDFLFKASPGRVVEPFLIHPFGQVLLAGIGVLHGVIVEVVFSVAQRFHERGWGVAQSSMTPIYHQYYRYYPGEMEMTESGLMATPRWPSHTSQFGVYYVRGAW